MKGTEHFVSLQTCAVLVEEYVMANSGDSVATLLTRCLVDRCRYNRVLLYTAHATVKSTAGNRTLY